MNRYFRLTPVLSALALLLTLAGCSGGSAVDNEPEAPIAGSTQESGGSDAQTTGESLVVYFSWSGNTQQMAQWVAEESGSDIYRITPAEAYSENYNACADRAKNELDNGIRPALDNLMDPALMTQYNTIYLGFPIWWYDLPMPMTAFLEQYDLSGKTILPFFSHNGSRSGASSLSTLTDTCTGAAVMTEQALSVSGNSVEGSESLIREWVKNLTY